MIKIISLFGLAAFLLLLSLGYAQQIDVEPASRPKIGLVLGGGGARGAAHVGVLRQLEAMRIPIDAVAGTSMGAIIGGLYASGTSADEIAQILAEIDWEDAFRNDQPRPDLSFRRKEDDFSFLIDFDLGFRQGRFLIPKGVIYGQKQNRIFRALLWPHITVNDFDDLPIPYRAVTTDIINGETKVMDSGSLINAMRASMSIPGLFPPVEVQGHQLVDGGISNNLPIDVVREMGVDILIVVDVSAPLYSAEDLQTALEITDQVSNVFIKRNTDRQIETLSADDILIKPDLGAFTSADFAKIAEVIPLGRIAAEQQRAQLEVLSLSEVDYQVYENRRRKGRREKPLVIDTVSIETNSDISPRVIAARIRTQPGDILKLMRLEEDLARIYGMQYFERVSADIAEINGKTHLEINAQAKSWGPDYVHFGIELTDDFNGGSEYNLAARFTKTELNTLAAEWRTDIQIGEAPKLVSEIYQPLSVDSRFFLASSLDYEQTGFNQFDNGERIAEFRLTSRTVDLNVGREFGNWGEIRIGVKRGEAVTQLRTGAISLIDQIDEQFDIGQYAFQLRYDKLDNVKFPLMGSRLEIDARFSRYALKASNEFDLYRFGWIGARTRGRYTLLSRLAFGRVEHETAPGIENRFRLGGFLNLSGLSPGELVGPYFAISNLIFYRRFGSVENNLLNVPVYIGGSLEVGNVWQTSSERRNRKLISAGSLFVGVDSFLGPLYLAAGLSGEGKSALYFFLGRGF